MVKLKLPLALALLCCNIGLAKGEGQFIVLSYHDIKDAVVEDASVGKTTVSTTNLEKQFEWLKQTGYHVISVDDLLQAKEGKTNLPSKSVLLSFDDGYSSLYFKVYPLLKQYHYPALVAVVGKWMEPNRTATGSFPHDDDSPAKESLLTWEQINEMKRSGWVEIASHSYDLHHGIQGNPQGNLQPAAVTWVYDPIHQSYETDAAYRQRIRLELKHASDSLFAHIGKKPRVMVWPYGETNQLLIQEAKNQGMGITLGLGDGHNTLADLAYARRLLIVENPNIEEFAKMVEGQRTHDRPLRVAHVDLDYIHDPDPVQTERNLGMLLDRIQTMGLNTVYLQAFADPDGDGNADALYFPNRHLPVADDLFNRTAWQLLTRTRVKVYAWMPVLAFGLKVPEAWFVHEWRVADKQRGETQVSEPQSDRTSQREKACLSTHDYKRLSPFNFKAKRMVGQIYEDLAKYNHFAGILFHDDAILTDYEDVTPQALDYVGTHWQLPTRRNQLRDNVEMRMKWAKHKTHLLVEWTDYLANIVRKYHPDLKTARNYYALPILEPNSEEWYAQSMASGLASYDYVAIEAMPFMEKAENPDAWLDKLVMTVGMYPEGLKKTVFELQTVDWNTRQNIAMEILLKQFKRMQAKGAIHLGYYPDNVYADHPRVQDMESAFALPQFP